MTPALSNLLADLPDASAGEVSTALLSRPGVHLERIVSQGQSTPDEEPMVQDRDEWVLLLEGEAGLRIGEMEVVLKPGDHLLIAAGQKHWVTYTAKDCATVWLALHFQA